jgi:hypothetical protein
MHNTVEKIAEELEYPFHRNLINTELMDGIRRDRQRVMRRMWLARVLSFGEYPVLTPPDDYVYGEA